MYQLRRLCQLEQRSACDIYAARRLSSDGVDISHRCHCDGGATASTTNHFEALWFCRKITGPRPGLRVADDTVHRPSHVGYLKVPTFAGGYVFVRTYYTKQIPATIISPFQLMGQLRYHAVSTHVTANFEGCFLRLCHPKVATNDLLFPCTMVSGLMYTEKYIMPTHQEQTSPLPIIGYVYSLRALAHSYRPPPKTDSSVASPSVASTCPTCDDSDGSLCPEHDSDPDPCVADLFLRYLRLGMMPDVSLSAVPTCGDLDAPACNESPPSETGEGTIFEAGEGTSSLGSTSEPGEGTPSPASDSFAGEGIHVETVSEDDCSVCTDAGCATPATEYCVCKMTAQQELLLWHARFGHLGHHTFEKMVKLKLGRGLPNQADVVHELDKCPVCLKAKLHKANRSAEDSRKAAECYQGISVDFGFIVQQSKNSERMQRLQGLHGETCYCLITDHYSGTIWGRCFSSKSAPIDFLDQWLRRYALPKAHNGANGEGKYVRLDGGGELGGNHEVKSLFENAGYAVEVTAPDSSHQNGPGERPHRSIGEALRAMLSGAGLHAKFWPYAFQHYVRLYNLVPHAGKLESPYQITNGKVPDLRFLRTFGCRVYTMVTSKDQSGKLEKETRDGIFLGYPQTQKNILYYDLQTNRVKTARHVAFDETTVGMESKTPNAEMLTNLRNGAKLKDVFDAQVSIPDIDVSLSPFVVTKNFEVELVTDSDSPIGMLFSDCNKLGRAFVHEASRAPNGHTLRAFNKHFLGSYIVSINEERVFNSADAQDIIDRLVSSAEPPAKVLLVLAPERRSDLKAKRTPVQLRGQDIRQVASLLAVDPSGMTSAEYNAAVLECRNNLDDAELAGLFAPHRTPESTNFDELQDATSYIRQLLPEEFQEVTEKVCRLQTEGMTDEERALPNFRYNNLKGLSTWDEWKKAHAKQLNSHFDDKCLGKPIPKADMQRKEGFPPSLMRIVWSNLVKVDGTRKARACVDGSKRGAPWLRHFADTYSSCIEMPCMRMFLALSAAQGYVLTVADTSNAFQQAPPPPIPCYLRIDEPYRDWYRDRFGEDIDPDKYVIPILKNLQGLSNAGASWERMINKILKGSFGFKNTTHERNLYRGTFEGQDILLCRMVDDYCVACADSAVASRFIVKLNEHVTTESKGTGDLIKERGLHLAYNGVDLFQTRDYIKVTCETFIGRLLKTHGWETPSAGEDLTDASPITEETVKRISRLKGPAEYTPEHKSLEAKMQFSYRQLLGECMYAYVTCRLDIAYAVCFLARFSGKPHEEHYLALKNIARYLRRTKEWGITYWRTSPVNSLPHVPHVGPPRDDSLPTFPEHGPFQLAALVDAAYANDLITRKSVTGLVFMLAGGAIAYKSKLQPIVAVSSTEAELYGAVHAAKLALYFRSILHELGYTQEDPTLMYEDNQAVINIVQNERPTSNLRHVDIQHFAIQQWRADKAIELRYIDTKINSADSGTKGLSWPLHHRHVRRAMGCHRPSYAVPSAT